MAESGSKAVATTAESQATKESKAEQKSDRLAQELYGAAVTFEEKQKAFQLATTYRQSQMIAAAAEAIAAESWGQKLNPVARASVARYAIEQGTDPVRHWYVLGGRLYDNAELWYDVAASQPDYAGADDPILIHDDPRLTDEEKAKRKALRVAWGCPEDTPGAAIVTIHTKERGSFRGCNWVKTGTYSDGKPRDPVGREHPAQTAITRAWRKACKKAWSIWFMNHPRLKSAEEVLTTGRSLPAPAPAEPVEAEAVEETGELVRHNPSGVCQREDEHLKSECGYEKAKP